MRAIKRAGEAYHASPFLKVLVYAESGGGKSTWAARAPRPLILLTEKQGLASIAYAAPDALILPVNSFAELREIVAELLLAPKFEVDGQPCLKYHDCEVQTVVVDGLTDAHNLALAEHRMLSKEGEDIPNWSSVQKLMLEEVIWPLRDMPANVVCTALVDFQSAEKGGKILPYLYGSLAGTVGQAFNAVGMLDKRSTESGMVHSIKWQRGSLYACKPAPGWPVATRNTMTPGQTTLGSLLLHSCSGLPVAHVDGDSADWVTTGAEPVAEPSRSQAQRPKAPQAQRPKAPLPSAAETSPSAAETSPSAAETSPSAAETVEKTETMPVAVSSAPRRVRRPGQR